VAAGPRLWSDGRVTTLSRPDPTRYDDWAATIAEFGDQTVHGSGMADLVPAPYDRAAFAELLARAERMADISIPAPEGKVHDDLLWIGDDAGLLVGFLSLRHRLNDFLLERGGHIGYSVRPSRRREGHAHRALGLALERAHRLGIDRVLVTCDDDNVGSARTIESQGGVMEDIRDGRRRYWIAR
jgi:predicted acetyltransferase